MSKAMAIAQLDNVEMLLTSLLREATHDSDEWVRAPLLTAIAGVQKAQKEVIEDE